MHIATMHTITLDRSVDHGPIGETVNPREESKMQKTRGDARNCPCVLTLCLALLCYSCRNGDNTMDQTAETEVMSIEVRSTAFEEGGMIPAKYTCDGKDISPPLQWAQVPEGTQSIALIADDPDAPSGTFVHWVLYGLSPDRHELTGDLPRDKTLPNGARQGVNSFGKIGYGGPCPPSGTHRYYFKLYALNTDLDLPPGESKAKLLNAMANHIVAKGQIMGRYKRQ